MLMQKTKRFFIIQILAGVIFFAGSSMLAQYPVNYQYTLLPSDVIDKILGASSGELAMQHIIGLAPYTRPRLESEFTGEFKEIEYVMGKLGEYRIRNYTLDPVGQATAWRGIEGSLWETSPGNSKIADFNDLPEMLVPGSQPADLTAGLVWIGEGQQAHFETNSPSVKGKIVVTSASPSSVHFRALNAGALGTVSFYSPRPLIDPLQIPNLTVGGRGFAFLLPPREGVLLRDRLLRHEDIEVHVKIDSRIEPLEMKVPQCLIEGTDPSAGEIIFTAHLFEGYNKMGANDNMSGSAVILEVAHLLNDLIEKGEISRPVRSIRFLWVPEFSGTIPWVNMHLAEVRRAMCNINLDMVGLWLRDNKSFMYLHRSGFSTAHFVNDVMESYYRYVGETNVEGITDRLGRRGFSRRIVSPTGTDDPFYYRISSLHGSSDNAVFNDWSINVPGVKMITWPDNYYHTSEDNPDKCDPTQLRRIIFIAAAGAYTMASADDKMAIRILAEMIAGASTRMGIQMAKASDMVWNSDGTTMADRYKRAVYNLEGFVMAEKSALDKVIQLSTANNVKTRIEADKQRLNDLLDIQLTSLGDIMTSRCRDLGINSVSISPDALEIAAMKIIPGPTERAKTMGNGGDRQYLASVPTEISTANSYRSIVNTSEVAGLANGRRNLLDIKKMVDAEFEGESPLQDIVNYFTVLKAAGLMDY